MKRCSRCGETKALTEFHACRSNRDGRQNYCKECNRAQIMQYSKDNPEWARAKKARRRAIKIGATTVKFSVEQLHAHYLAEFGALVCVYCAGPYEHNDHVVPLARGGDHSLINLAPSCGSCNMSKGKKLLAEWWDLTAA